jgi:hypothetical protein
MSHEPTVILSVSPISGSLVLSPSIRSPTEADGCRSSSPSISGALLPPPSPHPPQRLEGGGTEAACSSLSPCPPPAPAHRRPPWEPRRTGFGTGPGHHSSPRDSLSPAAPSPAVRLPRACVRAVAAPPSPVARLLVRALLPAAAVPPSPAAAAACMCACVPS